MILYFDTETTGLRPGHIIQLSYIMDYGQKIICKNFYFATDYIEPSASKVHGFTVEKLYEVSKGKRFIDYIDEIDADFKNANLIVSHNFNFDFNFMNAEFNYNFKQFTFKESLDTMRYFTPIMKLKRPFSKGIKYPKLEELSSFSDVYPFEVEGFVEKNFGYTATKSHDAMFDTASMYLSVINCTEKFEDFNLLIKKYL